MTTPTGVRAEAYHYDDLNRLDQVTYSDDNGTIDPTDKVVTYTYDKNGNRLSQTTYANGIPAGATETLTYGYGFENRLTSVTDQTGAATQYFYDWRGNQVMKVTPVATTRYTYDGRNLLVAVDDGTNHIEYTYDAGGRRIAQNVNGAVTRFVVDPSNPLYQTIEERDDAGGVGAAYTYGLDRIAGVFPGQASPTYYLPDGLGSVGMLVDNTGNATAQYQYEAFGELLTAPSGTLNPFAFTGEYLDPKTRLLYLRARYFDPETAAFIAKDPAGFSADSNLYRYSGNNPVMNTDPSGSTMMTSIAGFRTKKQWGS